MQYDFQMPRTIPNYHEQNSQLLQVLQFQQLQQQRQQHFQFHTHFQQQQIQHHQHQLHQSKPLIANSPSQSEYPSPDIAITSTAAVVAATAAAPPPLPTALVTPTISPTSASPASTSSTTLPTSKRQSRAKSKRVRTIFTPEQLKRLEMEFSNQMYLVGHDRGFLASSLNLTEAQVKVWFQNRRIKHRKLNPSSAPIL